MTAVPGPAEALDLQERALDALLAELGLPFEEPDDPRVARLAERHPDYPQYHRIGHKRQTAYRALTADRGLARAHADAVHRALVHDDDPSSPRWLAAVLVSAIGARGLQERLLTTLATGTPHQRRCAAHAWRWADADPADPRYLALLPRSGA
ncbi:hypothetical protein [Streptomyces sp. NRRL B-24484]|uniref:hypothetical protein n=1 Tax=Streptomyces sp. NRRL B-24484 TaxID=1463833 RepID=UPI0004BFD90A|nr:hypothetical protein [Streptomyces sp. NRRL B-24484]